jgi:cell division protein FtsB
MPFDFDPLSLDFPALTLRCLQPPPTLFSSTQHPTSTSWSVQYPGRREFEALKAFFEEHFSQWKATCAAATTASMEELLYPPKKGPLSNAKEAVKKSQKQAEIAARQVSEHLESAYTVWSALPEQRQNELWVLELARSVGRRQKEMESMKETQHKLQQEVSNLKSQVEQLSRLQQPREFKLMAPTTIPFDPELVNHVLRTGLKSGHKGVGFEMEDKQLDLSEIVSRSIERWKSVITSTRATTGGMGAQRPLGQTPNATPTATPTPLHAPQHRQPTAAQMQETPTQEPPTPQAATTVHRRSTNTSATGMSERGASLTTGPSSVQSSEHDADGDADADAVADEEADNDDDDDGDDDADGDMDADMDADGDADGDVDISGMEQDDSFSMMNTPPAKASHPQHHMATLDVPRTRQPMQHHVPDDGQQQYMLQSNMPDTSHMNMARSMPNLQAAMQTLHSNDMGLVMGVRTDHMYLD